MPAIPLDVAIFHMNRADAAGNGQYLGDDPYFDPLFAMAAKRRFMSAERIIRTEDFASHGPRQSLCINRTMTDGVVEAPLGAHFTACEPDYGRDEPFQREYAAAAADPALYRAFKVRYLDLESHDEYRRAVEGGVV